MLRDKKDICVGLHILESNSWLFFAKELEAGAFMHNAHENNKKRNVKNTRLNEIPIWQVNVKKWSYGSNILKARTQLKVVRLGDVMGKENKS